MTIAAPMKLIGGRDSPRIGTVSETPKSGTNTV